MADLDPSVLNQVGAGKLPGHLGVVVEAAEPGRVRATMVLAEHHFAPNGYVHAGAVVTLADTACGYGCMISRPEGAVSFTTIELKSNFLGSAKGGVLAVEATLVHGGRQTQVWDATVTRVEDGKAVALFRCTQMVLYPK